MFSKNSKEASTQTAAKVEEKPSPPTLISRDLRIDGNLNSSGEVQIDGTVEGDIRTKTLLIGETATIKGAIVADTVRVHGSVHGQIKARSVSLARNSHVVGDILHEDLSIETGAFLEGHCRRIESKDVARDSSDNKINLVGSAGELSPALSKSDAQGSNPTSGGTSGSKVASQV